MNAGPDLFSVSVLAASLPIAWFGFFCLEVGGQWRRLGWLLFILGGVGAIISAGALFAELH